MHDFTKYDFLAAGLASRPVYRKGQGPAIVIMHELPGMVSECIDLARRIADAGFTVFLPLLFGKPDQEYSWLKTGGYSARLCVSREFRLFATNQSSPITNWLRELCRMLRQSAAALAWD